VQTPLALYIIAFLVFRTIQAATTFTAEQGAHTFRCCSGILSGDITSVGRNPKPSRADKRAPSSSSIQALPGSTRIWEKDQAHEPKEASTVLQTSPRPTTVHWMQMQRSLASMPAAAASLQLTHTLHNVQCCLQINNKPRPQRASPCPWESGRRHINNAAIDQWAAPPHRNQKHGMRRHSYQQTRIAFPK